MCTQQAKSPTIIAVHSFWGNILLKINEKKIFLDEKYNF